VCLEIQLHSQLLQHNSAFIRDEEGNPAEIKSVELINQTSIHPCVRWESFAHYGSAVIVKDGCQGKFNVCYSTGAPQPSVPITESQDCLTVRLLSQVRKPAEKTILRSDGKGDLIVSMALIESFSAVTCILGLTFNYLAHKVEARYGCRGDFRVCLDPLIILDPDLPEISRNLETRN
ncbi:unnamed protein product, partial [Candidula unifasciata]